MHLHSYTPKKTRDVTKKLFLRAFRSIILTVTFFSFRNNITQQLQPDAGQWHQILYIVYHFRERVAQTRRLGLRSRCWKRWWAECLGQIYANRGRKNSWLSVTGTGLQACWLGHQTQSQRAFAGSFLSFDFRFGNLC